MNERRAGVDIATGESDPSRSGSVAVPDPIRPDPDRSDRIGSASDTDTATGTDRLGSPARAPRDWRPWRLCALSSALMVLAQPLAVGRFEALALSWNGLLAWVALVPWWMAIRDATPRDAFRRTWAMQLLYFVGSGSWVFVAFHTFGRIPRATSAVLTLVLCAMLSFFVATAARLARRVETRGGLPAVATVPLLWAAVEYVRTYLLTGLPWASIGYTQWRLLPVIQIADVTGVYGVVALLVLVNVALAEVLVARTVPSEAPLPARTVRRLAGVATAAVLATIGYGAARIAWVRADQRARPTMRVAFTQGNVGQAEKQRKGSEPAILARYRAELGRVEAAGASLVVWPEAALPRSVHLRSSHLPDHVLPDGNRAWLLAGAVSSWHDGGKRMAHNSALLVSPGGRIAGRYHKSHLVPFGEYVPMERLLFFARKLTAYAGHFLAGRSIEPLAMEGRRLGVLICYEDIFPEVARRMTARGADLLVNITNDAWYGRSSAPFQHLSMVVFRAVENRRPVARAAQTGVSGFVAADGSVLSTTRIFEGPVSGVADVPIGGPASPYVPLGDLFAGACLGLAAAAFAGSRNAGSAGRPPAGHGL